MLKPSKIREMVGNALSRWSQRRRQIHLNRMWEAEDKANEFQKQMQGAKNPQALRAAQKKLVRLKHRAFQLGRKMVRVSHRHGKKGWLGRTIMRINGEKPPKLPKRKWVDRLLD